MQIIMNVHALLFLSIAVYTKFTGHAEQVRRK